MRTKLVATFFLIAFVAGCSFGQHKCKSNQAEAKTNLQSLQAVMVMAKAEEGRYPRHLGGGNFTPSGDLYEYKITKVDDHSGFLLQAVGKGEMAGDVWQVNQLGEITVVTDRCK